MRLVFRRQISQEAPTCQHAWSPLSFGPEGGGLGALMEGAVILVIKQL